MSSPTRRGLALAALFAMLALVASACAGASGSGSRSGSGSGGSGSASSSPPGRTDLRIVVTPGFVKGPPVRQYRLTCDPPGGTVPDPAAACDALASSPELLTQSSPCLTPDVGKATVSGVFRGRPVHLRFGMCGTDRGQWARLASVLGVHA
jgi:Subtilisin inhibitor-like